jgi:hypothetical protein
VRGERARGGGVDTNADEEDLPALQGPDERHGVAVGDVEDRAVGFADQQDRIALRDVGAPGSAAVAAAGAQRENREQPRARHRRCIMTCSPRARAA